jgi:hypothetical protein
VKDYAGFGSAWFEDDFSEIVGDVTEPMQILLGPAKLPNIGTLCDSLMPDFRVAL